ncbi:MAG: phosphatase PAP2 family protein [Myxococcales bacterium]|nr:phosphatase PAP2 family protein [Myxococcales bacterium]
MSSPAVPCRPWRFPYGITGPGVVGVAAFLACFGGEARSAVAAPSGGEPSTSPQNAKSTGATQAGAEPEEQVRPGSGRFEQGGGDSLVWNKQWKRYTVGNGVLTGIAVTTFATAYAIGPNEDEPWTSHVGFDEAARDVLRAGGRHWRQRAEDYSDVGLTLAMSYPLLVDSLIVSSWYRDSPDIGVQTALIDLEAISFTLAIQSLANLASGRERPYGRTCGAELDANTSDCVNVNRYRSFFSGHTSASFAAAAVNCVHHTKLPIYGENSALAPCLGGFALAGFVGTMRIVSDFHYMSDVLTGAIVGTGVGIAVPLVLHYRKDTKETPGLGSEEIEVRLMPTPGGIGVWGSF